ncbi:hypothetical protein F4777DRAFT_599092 [Nemania sp. FL0916]|nr:hypothetical protein F4777DRAFT_599092 [Nemania sp. FL0916]
MADSSARVGSSPTSSSLEDTSLLLGAARNQANREVLKNSEKGCITNSIFGKRKRENTSIAGSPPSPAPILVGVLPLDGPQFHSRHESAYPLLPRLNGYGYDPVRDNYSIGSKHGGVGGGTQVKNTQISAWSPSEVQERAPASDHQEEENETSTSSSPRNGSGYEYDPIENEDSDYGSDDGDNQEKEKETRPSSPLFASQLVSSPLPLSPLRDLYAPDVTPWRTAIN